MNKELTCNDQKLYEQLNSVCEEVTDQQFIEHLEQCERCQKRLESLAANEDDWIKMDAALSKPTLTVNDPWDFTAEFRSIANKLEARERRIRSVVSNLLSPPSHPEMLGRIGRYEVERCIGIGGMGVVFKAFDTELNRPVAIKVLSPHLSDHPSARARFAREARAAAAVVHEHVVPIYNVETEEQQPFLVMHLVAGESLQERIDRVGALELREILRIGSQLAQGLYAAHQQGLIHRDIKPANVLLEHNVERALITDFGLARMADDASLTVTGSHLGTPQFMSPEQASNSPVDTRSDLFSFGSVLYNMCTGKPPFQAETSLGVLRQIVDTEPPSISELNPLIPEWLCAIVGRLMSKCPEERFEDARQVAELLTACLAHVQQPSFSSLPTEVLALMAKPKSFFRTAVYFTIGVALAALLTMASILIKIDMDKGTIAIECEGNSVPVRILRGNELVKSLQVSQEETLVRVEAGEYKIEVDKGIDGIEVLNGIVSLKQGSVEQVRIVQVPSIEHPPVAIVMIIHPDVLKNGNTIQRVATSEVVKRLQGNDYCGILQFGPTHRIDWLWSDDGGLARIGSKKDKFTRLAATSNAGDLPDMPPAIAKAIDELKKVDVARKHILIFTDGTPVPPTTEVLAVLLENKITVSLVYPDIFEFGVTPIYRELVEKTGGNFHYLTRHQSDMIERAFVSELEDLRIDQQRSMEKIGEAFDAYHRQYLKFPGSKNLAKSNTWTARHPYSWRVAILPLLGETELYNQYRFDEPWDSTRNLALLSKMPAIYKSFPKVEKQADGDTRLQGFAMESGGLGGGTGESQDSFSDGLDRTVMLIESTKPVPWTKPEDLTDSDVDSLQGQWIRVLFADGKVHAIKAAENFKALVTRNLADEYSAPEVDPSK